MSIDNKMFPSLPSSHLHQERAVWGRMFGHCIHEARKTAGLSIEQAAILSGMETSAWTAIEEGHVPRDSNRLRAMADTMHIRFDQIVMLVVLCRKAWEL